METDLRVMAEETERDSLQVQDPMKCVCAQSVGPRLNIKQDLLAVQLNAQNVVRP